jgi:hypothetical protein
MCVILKRLMPFWAYILMSITVLSSALATLQCSHLFSGPLTVIEAPYDSIYAGQTLVGKDYAVFKELRDAGLNPKHKLEDLSKKHKKILQQSVLAELADPVPAARDPQGRIFLLDGHHSICRHFARRSF